MTNVVAGSRHRSAVKLRSRDDGRLVKYGRAPRPMVSTRRLKVSRPASCSSFTSAGRRTPPRWEDMHADHILAYIKGGKTALGNGAITHSWCNEGKSAR
jgi:hypothetical protein